MKKVVILITGLFAFSFCYTQNNTDILKKQLENERLKMKNYAFCSCLVMSYKMQDSTYKKKMAFLESKKDDTIFITEDSMLLLPPNSLYIKNLDSLFVKDGSVSAYFQMGAYKLNAYDSIKNFIMQQNTRGYSSYDNNTLVMMKCIDLYNSKELEDKIKELDKFINKNHLNRSRK